ncbi:YegP family protein [Luteolibacter sp. LG18]|uniref:YegP family protein n=1 Tax=Luteolibacter sp. LG18 TaxID=2819286 RepID=UPI002B2A6B81|nr:hypothetical protein llg_06530 [Luteolibacter sp. LG18]
MYELFKSEASGKYHFRLKAGNGEIILSSEAYEAKPSAENGIASVKKNGTDRKNFEIRQSSSGKSYFVLKAGNGQIIGQSQQYVTEAAAENGIASVIKNAGGETKDLTA